jgi:uncharacterized oxidoreductase
MKIQGNTILITGGGTGIGKGLAEAFHRAGNVVIIAGRRNERLTQAVKENPGMHHVVLDVADPKSINKVSKELLQKFPDLNVVINNAGFMEFDDFSKPVDDSQALSLLTTNVMGPIRIASAFVEHLKTQKRSYIVNVSSVLGFTPLAVAGVYSATKAALHSYSLSLRNRLQGTSVRVIEVIPPWVATELVAGAVDDPRAMPLNDFIKESMEVLSGDIDECIVYGAKPFRVNVGTNDQKNVEDLTNFFTAAAPAPVAV